MNSVGIVGFGSFGQLLAQLLAPHVTVLVTDKHALSARLPQTVHFRGLADVAACDVVVIATDLSGIRSVCKQLAKHVRPGTIVMDICSVKVLPARILREELPGKCRLLATHPLFGPNSVEANGGTARGLTMMWHEIAGGPFKELESLFAQKLDVRLLRLTPEEHDQQMAWIHALTFFVGRGLTLLEQPQIIVETGYYQKLRDLIELEQTHSWALFNTIEAGNPYAADVRRQLLDTMQLLDERIKEVHYD
jgi:prephenate dehydrogenase